LKDGMQLAENSIDGGRAVAKLDELVRMTNASD